MTHLFLTSALAFGLMSALWPLSLVLEDASIVDITWGPAFAVLGWAVLWGDDGAHARGLVPLFLVSLWALRLSTHILLRRLESGKEDRRYTAIRIKFGVFFPVVSLFIVFWLQAFLLWLVSWPLQAAVAARGAPGALDIIGWTVTLAGIVIEAVADYQLASFRAAPCPKGDVMDKGLWRFTRHPNYFGDFLIWWGFFLAGAAAGAPWWIIASPVTMSVLLMHVSGVGLMEDTIIDRRPGYRAYIARTNAFFPWPPARG